MVLVRSIGREETATAAAIAAVAAPVATRHWCWTPTRSRLQGTDLSALAGKGKAPTLLTPHAGEAARAARPGESAGVSAHRLRFGLRTGAYGQGGGGF